MLISKRRIAPMIEIGDCREVGNVTSIAKDDQGTRGQTLDMLRNTRGLTRKQLARKSGIPESKILQWESDISDPDEKEIAAMAKVLDYPDDAFYQEAYSVRFACSRLYK